MKKKDIKNITTNSLLFSVGAYEGFGSPKATVKYYGVLQDNLSHSLTLCEIENEAGESDKVYMIDSSQVLEVFTNVNDEFLLYFKAKAIRLFERDYNCFKQAFISRLNSFEIKNTNLYKELWAKLAETLFIKFEAVFLSKFGIKLHLNYTDYTKFILDKYKHGDYHELVCNKLFDNLRDDFRNMGVHVYSHHRGEYKGIFNINIPVMTLSNILKCIEFVKNIDPMSKDSKYHYTNWY